MLQQSMLLGADGDPVALSVSPGNDWNADAIKKDLAKRQYIR
jgi:hypothetical protein